MNYSYPTLPGMFRLPLKLLPNPVGFLGITSALNTLFDQPLKDDELCFMAGKHINICVEDAALNFSLQLTGDRLRAGPAVERPDLAISGELYAFLLLGTRREDADTLFFRRQIKSEGDTELGLFVKNFLDGLEPESLTPAYATLNKLMLQALWVAERFPARTSGNANLISGH